MNMRTCDEKEKRGGMLAEKEDEEKNFRTDHVEPRDRDEVRLLFVKDGLKLTRGIIFLTELSLFYLPRLTCGKEIEVIR